MPKMSILSYIKKRDTSAFLKDNLPKKGDYYIIEEILINGFGGAISKAEPSWRYPGL
jgi:hypothetical protein